MPSETTPAYKQNMTSNPDSGFGKQQRQIPQEINRVLIKSQRVENTTAPEKITPPPPTNTHTKPKKRMAKHRKLE